MKTRLKLRAAAVVILLMAAGVFAQELPRIAVYVTGNVGEDEKKALGTRMLASLVNSGRYKGIERSNSFLAEIEKEQVKQMSGDIDDSQISALGKQFGVKFVCIADITPAFGDFQVSARIVNVETAEVDFIGEAFSPLQTSNDLVIVSDNVVENMFSGKTSAAQQQQPTVVVIQQPAQQTKEPKVKKPSKYDRYFAPKYALPIGGMPLWGAVNLEGGLIWGKGTFFGIDIDGGYGRVNYNDGFRQGGMGGLGLNLGNIYDLPVENLQLVYGGSIGFWLSVYDNLNKYSYDFLAPFIKFRWKHVELSYRGLLGTNTFTGKFDEKEPREHDYGFDLNHQVMLGVHFATSKRVRK